MPSGLRWKTPEEYRALLEWWGTPEALEKHDKEQADIKRCKDYLLKHPRTAELLQNPCIVFDEITKTRERCLKAEDERTQRLDMSNISLKRLINTVGPIFNKLGHIHTGRSNAQKFNISPMPGHPLPIPGTKAYEDHKSRVKRVATAIDFSVIEARITAMQTYGVLYGRDVYDVDGTDISHKNLNGDDRLKHLYFIHAVKSVEEYLMETTAVGLFIEQFELDDGTTVYACDFTDRLHMFDEVDTENGDTKMDEYIKCDFDFRQFCFDLGIKVEPSPIGKYGKSYEWE